MGFLWWPTPFRPTPRRERGMKGTYQHASRDHLHRCCAEFDFRYSNRAKLGVDDVARFTKIVEGVTGKRLMYSATSGETTVQEG
jgi:hypothetical protein